MLPSNLWCDCAEQPVSLGLCVCVFVSPSPHLPPGKKINQNIHSDTNVRSGPYLFICSLGSLVMAFHLRVLCLQTNVPPQDSNNKKSTLPRWEPLNHSLGLLKLFLIPLIACDGPVAELGWPVHSHPCRMQGGFGEKQL